MSLDDFINKNNNKNNNTKINKNIKYKIIYADPPMEL